MSRSTLTRAQMGHKKQRRPALTRAQMEGSMRGRATLTEAQMEGEGIFGDIGRWLKKAAKTVNRGLKKTKILSTVASGVAPLLALHPATTAASAPVGIAGKFLKQHGYGTTLPGGGRTSPRPRNITAAQVRCLAQGHGRRTSDGGVAIDYPRVRNISPRQMKFLAAGKGRMLKGGGISLAGGAASGNYGSGVRLAGQGKKKRLCPTR